MSTAVVDRWPLVGRWDELDMFDRAVASDAADGIVLFGPAGVGKTRLAEEMRTQLERSGRSTGRAVASRTAGATPLGALAHLLPADVVAPTTASEDPAVVFRHVADDFAARDEPPVLVVDDLHLLDATSLALMAQLVANGLVFLVATVRTDEALPDGVDTLMRSDRLARIDLTPLARADVETLLHLALGAPVEGAAVVDLWNATHGNVLFLRELVLAARASGALTDVDGVWSLTGRLQTTGRLAELLEQRLANVDANGMRVLETLACCQRIGLGHAADLCGVDALDALERDGLISVVADDRRRFVVFAHPMHGELVRGALGVVRMQRLFADAATRVERDGARRREDALLVASWRLAANEYADVGLLVGAARLARYAHDFAQVQRLASAAHRESPSPEAAHLLGEALYERGRFDEAEAVLAPMDDAAALTGDATTAAFDVAAVRAINLLWGLQRADDALTVLRRARERATNDDDRELLLAGEGTVLMSSGRPRDALFLLEAMPKPDDARVRVARAIAEAPALALVGRTSEALDVAQQGLDDHGAIGNVVAMANPGAHVMAQVFALMEAGRLDEAQQLSGVVHEIVLSARLPIPRMWATLNLGRIALLRGLPATARRWFMESASLARTTGFVAIRRLALSGIGVSAALLRDIEAASAAAAECAPVRGDRSFVAPELWLGGAWAAFASADPARARELLLIGAREAEETGHVTAESWLLHDAARLGAASDVAERLTVLAGPADSALVRVRAQHANALASGDAAELAACVEPFSEIGAVLCAAEAAVAAGDAYRRAGEQRRATAMDERAAALRANCEGAVTPGLVSAGDVVPLTNREREIATLAAEGLPSKEIAERLFLSARTVDNHLQRVYTKLGVSRRADLARALAAREEQS